VHGVVRPIINTYHFYSILMLNLHDMNGAHEECPLSSGHVRIPPAFDFIITCREFMDTHEANIGIQPENANRALCEMTVVDSTLSTHTSSSQCSV
jgi:hypothetical protein